MVEEYEGSGQTRRAFCARRGMAVSTLDYWRRELAKKPRLVAVKIAQPEARFALVLSNGRRIECGEAELARLIAVAERA